MKVALDATPLTVPRSGIGEYTYHLARHLALRFPEDEFLLLSRFPFPEVPGPSNLKSLHCRTNRVTGRWWLLGLPLILEREKVSVFHGTDYAVPFLPLRPCVLTIHDLSCTQWSHLHESRTRRTAHRLPWMASVARHVVTGTTIVRRQVMKQFNLPEEKVSVIPLAPAPHFCQPTAANEKVLAKYGLRSPYVLFVGTLEPRKNLVTLVRAFSRLPSALLHRVQLVLCGRIGWQNDDLWAEIARQGLKDKVRVTGHVSEDELPSIYRGATVFVYPSLYEGFGLPPLEAMACGIPVIVSTDPALSEVVGDAAMQVDPLDVERLSRAMAELLVNRPLRETLVRRGLLNVARFSWADAADRMHALYDRVLSEYLSPKWGPVYRALLHRLPMAG